MRPEIYIGKVKMFDLAYNRRETRDNVRWDILTAGVMAVQSIRPSNALFIPM